MHVAKYTDRILAKKTTFQSKPQFNQAEAEYEALKGLLEHRILLDLRERPGVRAPGTVTTGPQRVAKKSTGQASRSGPGDRCRNVSRKSTGAGAKFWPETKIDQPYSFYGIQPDRFDPKLIKTRMAMGEFG